MLEFQPNTLAFMTAALEQSCKQLKDDSPEARKFIADKLMEGARSGGVTMAALIEVGKKAVTELNTPTKASGGRRKIVQLADRLLGRLSLS
jgi:urease gamma subunit